MVINKLKDTLRKQIDNANCDKGKNVASITINHMILLTLSYDILAGHRNVELPDRTS